MDTHAQHIRVVWNMFKGLTAHDMAVIKTGADGDELVITQLTHLPALLK